MADDHGDGHRGWSAVPAVDPDAEDRAGPAAQVVDVDGERFAVRQVALGSWSYEWLSGPNPGYGFAISGPPHPSAEEHRQAIRSFLSMIDPTTGYIEDD